MTKAAQALFFCLVSILVLRSGLFAQSENLAAKSQRAGIHGPGQVCAGNFLYRELNQAVPNNAGLMLNLGMALHMAGAERQSLPPLETAVKLRPVSSRMALPWRCAPATRPNSRGRRGAEDSPKSATGSP